MNYRIAFLITFLFTFLFTGCAGVTVNRDPMTGKQTVNEWDRTWFGTNTDRRVHSECDPEIVNPDEYQYQLDSLGKNCKKVDVRHSTTPGSVNQLAMPAAVVAAGYFVYKGLKDSGDNINNDSSSNSKQYQSQYQKQYNKGRYKHY